MLAYSLTRMAKLAIVEDTSAAVHSMVVSSLRAMSPSERFDKCVEMTSAVEALMIAGIRIARPRIDDSDIPRELVRRRYGSELAVAAYGAVHRGTSTTR